MIAALVTGFFMGITGSLHCAGMCGPIICVMPFQLLHGLKKWVGISLYHLGRVSVYAFMGYILHSFQSFFNPHWQQYISMALGGALLVAGLFTFFPSIKIRLPWTAFVKNKLSDFIGKPGLTTLFISGILNGLLPCGLVYMALSISVVASTGLQSLFIMYAFGLGTMPMLIGLTVLKNKMKGIRMLNARRFVPLTMFFFGCLFMLRGMNLGIPYLSPKMTVENHEIKTSCCHR